MALFASLTLTLIPQAIAQEKLTVFIHCYDCPSESEYLLKVFEPTTADSPKLIGEKKFISKDLGQISFNNEIYLDKKFTGKKLDFELISLTSGLSSSKSVYVLGQPQEIYFNPPVGEQSRYPPQSQLEECHTSPDGREKYCGYVNE